MPRSPAPKLYERNIALCYIRQSQSRDEDDKNSPQRQRDNIRLVCERNGWIPEWYEDVGGHRSGTSEKKRPEWLALKRRLGDPDVVALVANDLSRFHRNLAGTSQLLDMLEQHGINKSLRARGSS
ncbi:MAG: recombinase family protein [Anaerolineae bacterium]|nr:MAG: recombinase family protein [Anaerolineae bacterium]